MHCPLEYIHFDIAGDDMDDMGGLYFREAVCLERCFCEDSICDLQLIFDEANHDPDQDKIANLNKRLESVLQQEDSCQFFFCNTSPTGQNHIIISYETVILLNIYGGYVLLTDGLFLDGELDLINIQWIENDNLVVFDLFYIVYNELRKCVCHFSNDDDRFVIFSPMEKMSAESHSWSIGNSKSSS